MVVRVIYEEFDRILVVDDHLRFQTVPAFRRFAEFDQPRRIQQRIGVALKAAGVPRQIDEQPVQNLLCISARCLIVKVGLADLREMRALFFRKIERLVGPV